MRRYTALIQVVNRLVEDEFLFPIVSSLGYVNDDMNKLMQLMENVSNEIGVMRDGLTG